MHFGRFTLGQFAPLTCVCTNGSGTPAAPTYAPTVKVYDSTGTRVLSALMPPLDRYGATGAFSYELRLGSSYAVGSYMVSMSWVISGTTYSAAGNFEVVAGGDADGAVVSMVELRKPHGNWLVQRLDSDQRVLARGPGI